MSFYDEKEEPKFYPGAIVEWVGSRIYTGVVIAIAIGVDARPAYHVRISDGFGFRLVVMDECELKEKEKK